MAYKVYYSLFNRVSSVPASDIQDAENIASTLKRSKSQINYVGIVGVYEGDIFHREITLKAWRRWKGPWQEVKLVGGTELR